MSCTDKVYYPNYNYESRIVEIGKQGTLIVKAWGKGRSIDIAKENAKKNALHDYIFKGFSSSNEINSSELRPLLTNSDAEDKNKEYFIKFFKKDGIYLKFASFTDENGNIGINDRVKEGKDFKIGIIVVINKALLIKELEDAGVKSKFGIN